MRSRKADNTWTSDALQRGDADAVRDKVLEDSSYLHERDYVGDTPLLTAIGFGDLELVRFLLAQGADPNVEVDDGYTCLLTAVESGGEDSASIVAELIRAGADLRVTGTNGWTPLHMAAARGQVEAARLLIDAGAEVDRRKEIDASETPLMEAAFTGQPSTVRLLLERGADPSLRDTIDNRTPLEIARQTAKGPDPEVVAHLKAEGLQIEDDEIDEMVGEMDLPADQLELMKESLKEVDLAQSYIDGSTELVKTGQHFEVIRILSEHR